MSIVFFIIEMDMMHPHTKYLGKKQEEKEEKGKTLDPIKHKACKSSLYIVLHCNIGVNEDIFHTSFTSWKYPWLLI